MYWPVPPNTIDPTPYPTFNIEAKPIPVVALDAVCIGVYLFICLDITLDPSYLIFFQAIWSTKASSNSAMYCLSAKLLEGCVFVYNGIFIMNKLNI